MSPSTKSRSTRGIKNMDRVAPHPKRHDRTRRDRRLRLSDRNEPLASRKGRVHDLLVPHRLDQRHLGPQRLVTVGDNLQMLRPNAEHCSRGTSCVALYADGKTAALESKPSILLPGPLLGMEASLEKIHRRTSHESSHESVGRTRIQLHG